ncbi:hypothetical protein XELAEV_18035137mg [Xenopus laevis]|nr:hypothetical protein XELAEV_18035137mg [Xenopus laevis]
MDTPSRGQGVGHVRLAQTIDEKVNLRTTNPIQGEQLLLWYNGQKSRMVDLQGLGSTSVSHGKDCLSTKCMLRSTNFHCLACDMEREKVEQAGEGFKTAGKSNSCLDGPHRRQEDLTSDVADCKTTVRKLEQPELSGKDKSAFTEIYKQQNTLAIGKDSNSGISAFSPVPARYGYKIKSLTSPCEIPEREHMNLYNIGDNLVVGTHCHNRFCTHCNFSFSKCPVNASTTETQPKSREATQLLPPTFTPLGATAQNLCAKCKLSFRMTSDLVLHMRSRHKKGITGEPQHKRRRELPISCPVCYAYFKERHHLSRHMTSHC